MRTHTFYVCIFVVVVEKLPWNVPPLDKLCVDVGVSVISGGGEQKKKKPHHPNGR